MQTPPRSLCESEAFQKTIFPNPPIQYSYEFYNNPDNLSIAGKY